MTSPLYITEYHEEVWQGDLTKKKQVHICNLWDSLYYPQINNIVCNIMLIMVKPSIINLFCYIHYIHVSCHYITLSFAEYNQTHSIRSTVELARKTK